MRDRWDFGPTACAPWRDELGLASCRGIVSIDGAWAYEQAVVAAIVMSGLNDIKSTTSWIFNDHHHHHHGQADEARRQHMQTLKPTLVAECVWLAKECSTTMVILGRRMRRDVAGLTTSAFTRTVSV